MENDYLIERINMDCPICEKDHLVEKHQRMGEILIKGEPVEFEEIYFLCPDSNDTDENEFVSAKIMDDNLLKARNAYRVKHGLLTSIEIASIRALYGLSQTDFAVIMGWGEITVTRYESKSIQDETYDQMMRMFRDDATFALKQLERQSSRFSHEKYEQIKNAIIARIEEYGVSHLIQRTIEAQYASYGRESDLNGYQLLNLNKVGNLIAFFAQYDKNLFKVKLMKQLWYVDAAAFKLRHRAVTGLVYSHKPYGALPIASSDIINLPTVFVEEQEINDSTAYHIVSKGGATLDCFDSDEIDIIYAVAKKFKGMNCQQIVDYMHEEDAYRATNKNQIIPFSKCNTLREF